MHEPLWTTWCQLPSALFHSERKFYRIFFSNSIKLTSDRTIRLMKKKETVWLQLSVYPLYLINVRSFTETYCILHAAIYYIDDDDKRRGTRAERNKRKRRRRRSRKRKTSRVQIINGRIITRKPRGPFLTHYYTGTIGKMVLRIAWYCYCYSSAVRWRHTTAVVVRNTRLRLTYFYRYIERRIMSFDSQKNRVSLRRKQQPFTIFFFFILRLLAHHRCAVRMKETRAHEHNRNRIYVSPLWQTNRSRSPILLLLFFISRL